jgi:hypothetical protein
MEGRVVVVVTVTMRCGVTEAPPRKAKKIRTVAIIQTLEILFFGAALAV